MATADDKNFLGPPEEVAKAIRHLVRLSGEDNEALNTSKCHCWSADDGTYHTLLDMRSTGGLPCDIHVHPPSGPDSGLVVLQIPHGSPEYVRSTLAASTSRLAAMHSELATMGRIDTPGAT